jgi:hypothetical protein
MSYRVAFRLAALALAACAASTLHAGPAVRTANAPAAVLAVAPAAEKHARLPILEISPYNAADFSQTH